MESPRGQACSVALGMVKAGEVSGQMDTILNRLADYMEAAEELSREIKSAMTYPVISMVLVVGITMFLMMGVVPTFKSVFESLDTDLPAITQMVLDMSNFLRANAVLVIGGMFASIIGTVVFKRTTTGQLLLRPPAPAAPGLRGPLPEGLPGALQPDVRDPRAIRRPDHGNPGHRGSDLGQLGLDQGGARLS